MKGAGDMTADVTITSTTEIERLAKMEVQVEQTNNAILRMESKVDKMLESYPTRPEVAEMFRARDKEIQELKDNQRDNKGLFAAWAGVIVAVIAAIIALVSIII